MKRLFTFIFRYIKFLCKAKGRHYIHSPFVFDLYENCILKKTNKIIFNKIENQRQKLLKDKSIIHIQDFGTGDNRDKNIADIVRHSSKPSKQARLLFRLAQFTSPEIIIELGTEAGFSSMYLAAACPEKKVITVEGSPEIAAIAESNFKLLSFENINLINDTFDNTLPGLNIKIINPAFIFIDGNHTKEATLRYFNYFISIIDKQSVMVLDDIYWSSGMMEAWTEIKKHPEVIVTIDLFAYGIVFFKTGLTKQDFILHF
jgi:predicted O-methyltransferase YrrM